MDQLDFKSSSYNYYPNMMIDLCVISYDDIDKIKNAVSQQTDQKVVWGPAEAESWWDVPYTLAYITKRNSTNEYTVVIKGTQWDSWDAWTKQDFAIAPPLVSMTKLVANAPTNAMISQGSYNGMRSLKKLTDPSTGQGIADFITSLKNVNVYVTGHSLGGTLTPVMFAYLNGLINNGGWPSSMALWSFAGLTSGDAGFCAYMNTLGNPEFPWRIHNTLDIAPFCWYSLNDIKNIYKPYKLDWGFPEDDFLEDKFKEAAGVGYGQPLGDQAIAGKFDSTIIDRYLWTAQALHQHHSTTYQSLVNKFYPVPTVV